MSLRDVKRVIARADVVVEVVDARDPWATRSPEIERYAVRLGKPLLVVVNKSDLVPRDVLEKWRKVLEKHFPVVFISATKRMGTRMLWRSLRRVAPRKPRGKPVVAAVVGIPNVGKSTIINYLKGSHSVGTSPIPGFTKSITRLRAAGWLRVIDTPGVVPRMSQEELALRGALRPESLDDPVPAAKKLLELIMCKKPGLLKELYDVEAEDPVVFLENLARRRGLLGKGGVPLVEEAARIVLRDWQTGKNTFYLEPEDYGLSA
ncbi:GTPase [Thermofilum pendens]|uniref:Ras superfamily GTP-binding protein YlqF n=1 Tax=Thermofilum pendens (strain DSM 2475 / Hrk 5) TaxID=368408 RepID=A1RYE5_THEPD|nr:GTPase [Thermofilum pendens]ABL78225.1 Ras superfamily GTP-binding protein YlqF [Thermofilum pendens Hrk 5]